jgi:DNA-directed RNA polymerase subunit RPC12/RpoP
MATIVMKQVRPGEVPKDGGTALQEDARRPVWSGNGPNDYVCVECGNVLARSMHEEQMTFRVRVRCAVCRTINVAENDDRTPEERRRRGLRAQQGQ